MCHDIAIDPPYHPRNKNFPLGSTCTAIKVRDHFISKTK